MDAIRVKARYPPDYFSNNSTTSVTITFLFMKEKYRWNTAILLFQNCGQTPLRQSIVIWLVIDLSWPQIFLHLIAFFFDRRFLRYYFMVTASVIHPSLEIWDMSNVSHVSWSSKSHPSVKITTFHKETCRLVPLLMTSIWTGKPLYLVGRQHVVSCEIFEISNIK